MGGWGNLRRYGPLGYAALVTRAGCEDKWEGTVVWSVEELVGQGMVRPASVRRKVNLFAVAPYCLLEKFIGDEEFFVG